MRPNSRHDRFSPGNHFAGALALADAAPEPPPSWRGLAAVYGSIATVPAVLFAAAHPPLLAALLGVLLVVGVAYEYPARLRGTSAGRPAVDAAVSANPPRAVEPAARGRTDGSPSWSGSD